MSWIEDTLANIFVWSLIIGTVGCIVSILSVIAIVTVRIFNGIWKRLKMGLLTGIMVIAIAMYAALKAGSDEDDRMGLD